MKCTKCKRNTDFTLGHVGKCLCLDCFLNSRDKQELKAAKAVTEVVVEGIGYGNADRCPCGEIEINGMCICDFN